VATITASSTVGIKLNPAIDTSPVTIGTGVTITNPGYPNAAYTGAGSTTFFVVQNEGTIEGAATSSGAGVYLSPGGAVTNSAIGSITAYSGIKISGGAGTVVNDSNIDSSIQTTTIVGSYLHTILVGTGAYLLSGGSVTNAAGASIRAGSYGVKISGAAGTVVNDGTITLTGRESLGGYDAVYLKSGGVVTNAVGAYVGGNNVPAFDIKILGTGGTVVNDGTFGYAETYLQDGGSVTNGVSAGMAGLVIGNAISGHHAGTLVNNGNMTSGRVVVFWNGGTVVNSGDIATTGAGEESFGIQINGSTGSVANLATGTITALYQAVWLTHPRGTVVNSGKIAGEVGTVGAGGTATAFGGIAMYPGGIVTNALGGSITGAAYGLDIGGGFGGSSTVAASGTVINNGYIAGTGTNGVGIWLAKGGTLTNGGSIIGNGGTAVSFYGTGHNLLVLDPGYGFSGVVVGSDSASNTLELASAVSMGTATGLGTEFLRFGSIVFDDGAKWSIAGLPRGLSGPISGFARDDTIELTGVTASGSSFVGGVLTLDQSGGGSVTLDLLGPFTLANFEVNNVAAGADVTFVPCFAAGTRVLAAAGEVPVEDLCFGDEMVTLNGCRLARLVWLGQKHIDCRRHQSPTDVYPIRVRAGALGGRLPSRDLLLSPDHAVSVGGALIPVRHLIDGSTIVQEPVDEVTYYHVELATHDVILAEGLPCESYLDTGNRAAFAADRQLGAAVFGAPGHSGR
jgi:hypothetical protein